METKMRMTRVALMSVVIGMMVAPLSAQFRVWDNEVRVRGGLATPEGGSDYWDEKEIDFTGDVGDLEDAFFAVDYRRRLNGVLGLEFSIDGWEGSDVTQYRTFEDQNGFPIRHEQALETTSLTVGLVVYLAPPRSPVVPYIGAGGGMYSWVLSESGEFIDFDAPQPEIFAGYFEDSGNAAGWYGEVGVQFGFGSGVTAFVEGRWHNADDDLGGDFEGFGNLELSYRAVGAGVGFRF